MAAIRGHPAGDEREALAIAIVADQLARLARPFDRFADLTHVTASAIVVGQCARATGSADSTGAITATSLTISAPTNGTCTSGFGFRGGFGGGAAGGPGTPGGASTGA